MNTHIGVWIDHRRAVVVTLRDGQETVATFNSDLERHPRLSGGSRSANPTGPQDVVSDTQRDRRYDHHLHRYYHEVQATIRDADGIWVFGPGEAKSEFAKVLQNIKHLAAKVEEISSADKLTLNQIAAAVREHFCQPIRA